MTFWWTYIAKTGIKNVKWTVVGSAQHVIHIIFHFQFDRISIIVFSAFKLLISVLFVKALSIYSINTNNGEIKIAYRNCPFILSRPIIDHIGNYYRDARLFKAFTKLFHANFIEINSLNCVRAIVRIQIDRIALYNLMRRPSAFVQFYINNLIAMSFYALKCLPDLAFIFADWTRRRVLLWANEDILNYIKSDSKSIFKTELTWE